ncbi:unnamed protein product, partial [Discosporangium mesarthrocarpum]
MEDSLWSSMCYGVPDPELAPKQPESPRSPRSLSVYPDGSQVACGDKQGNILVFDLGEMRLLHKQTAHNAEILSMSYSPFLVPTPAAPGVPAPGAGAIGGTRAGDGEGGPGGWEAIDPNDLVPVGGEWSSGTVRAG